MTGTACHEVKRRPKIEISRISKIFLGIRKQFGIYSHICENIRYCEGTENTIPRIRNTDDTAKAARLLRSFSDSIITMILLMADVIIKIPYIQNTACPIVIEEE